MNPNTMEFSATLCALVLWAMIYTIIIINKRPKNHFYRETLAYMEEVKAKAEKKTPK